MSQNSNFCDICIIFDPDFAVVRICIHITFSFHFHDCSLRQLSRLRHNRTRTLIVDM